MAHSYFLMRHAHCTEGPQMDPTRDLTHKGKHQCKIMRRFLKSIDVVPDVIICSPFLRGFHTAERMAKKNHAPITQLKELVPFGDPEKAWKAINDSLSKKDETVLVIGHHPLIQKMAAAICFSLHDHPEMFNHGNILHIDPDEKKGGKMHSFHWFMTAKLAEKLQEPALKESYDPDELSEDVEDAAMEVQEALAGR